MILVLDEKNLLSSSPTNPPGVIMSVRTKMMSGFTRGWEIILNKRFLVLIDYNFQKYMFWRCILNVFCKFYIQEICQIKFLVVGEVFTSIYIPGPHPRRETGWMRRLHLGWRSPRQHQVFLLYSRISMIWLLVFPFVSTVSVIVKHLQKLW